MLSKKYQQFSELAEEYDQIKKREDQFDLQKKLLDDLEDTLRELNDETSKLCSYQDLFREYAGEFTSEVELDFSMSQEEFNDITKQDINQEEEKAEEALNKLAEELEQLESQLLSKVESSKRSIQEKLLILNIPSIRKDSNLGDEETEKLEEINQRLDSFLENPSGKHAEQILELERKLDDSKYEELSWEEVRKEKEISRDTQKTLMKLFESGSLEITEVSDEVLKDLEKFPKLTKNIRVNYEG